MGNLGEAVGGRRVKERFVSEAQREQSSEVPGRSPERRDCLARPVVAEYDPPYSPSNSVRAKNL
jgi:hypothetical protein